MLKKKKCGCPSSGQNVEAQVKDNRAALWKPLRMFASQRSIHHNQTKPCITQRVINYTWPLSEEIGQEKKPPFDKMDCRKCRCVFALTLRMLLIGMSVKVPAGAAGAAAGAGAAGAAAGVGATATACRWESFDLHLKQHGNKTLRHINTTTTLWVFKSTTSIKIMSFWLSTSGWL